MKVEVVYDKNEWLVISQDGKILQYDRDYGSGIPWGVEKAILKGLGVDDENSETR